MRSVILMLALVSRVSAFTVPRASALRHTVRAASDNAFDGYSSEVAFCFPGQGAQYVGMCKDVVETVPKAKELFEKASAILGYDLWQVCTEGPKEKLDTTAVSQPAIFVASMCAVEKLRLEKGDEAANTATVAMGLSLGEYSALCYAGALSFEDGVRITKARGEAMQAAADLADSSMVSVIGLDSATVELLCKAASEKSGKKVQLANLLCNGNYAVSGDAAACDAVMAIAKPDFKARMTIRLAVAGAFHTDFMLPAVASLKEVLETVDLKAPRIPVVCNVDAKPHSDPATIKQLLMTQVTAPVQWEATMNGMLANGYKTGYELGPGKVITGILKRTSKEAAMENVEV